MPRKKSVKGLARGPRGPGQWGSTEEGIQDGLGGLPELPKDIPEAPAIPRRRVREEGWERLGRTGNLQVSGELVPPGLRERQGIKSPVRDAEISNAMPKLPASKLRGKQNIRWGEQALTKMLKLALLADDGYWARRVVNGLIVRASKGNPGAQKILWDRAEGVLTEKLNLSGTVSVQKEVILTDIRDVPDLPPLEINGEVVQQLGYDKGPGADAKA